MVKVKNISKDYADETGYTVHLLKDISFEIPGGKLVSIVAPTGAGKSTLLKIISGLIDQSDGGIEKGNERIIFIPSKPSSFPWLNVKENVTFGLEKYDESKIKKLVEFVGLDGYEDHQPANKSFGFRFRISMARALMNDPGVIVIDESFNEMKDTSKHEIYSLLRKTISEFDISILLGTTNITEAILLSDEIVLMGKNPGRIISAINITFDSDRNISLVKNEKFAEYRKKLEHEIKQSLGESLFTFKL